MSLPYTEMEERVARAIWEASSGPMDFITPDGFAAAILEARAAIRAMREPTEDMLVAGAIVEVDTGWGGRGSYKPVGDAYRETRWKQMIDAASPPDK
jgi:hypothetical protein